MTIQQLNYFVAVAQYLSFSEAAKHLYVSQTAISHSIAGLEAELGFKLFYRDTRSVKLTAAGNTFLPEVEMIQERLDHAIAIALQVSSGHSGTISIGFLSSLMKTFFADWIPPFKEKYPNINLRIEQLYAINLRNALEKDLIDLAITRSYDLEDAENLSWVKLFDAGSSIIMHEDNPLAAAGNESEIDYELLAKQPFIVISPNTSPYWYQKMLKICANRGFTPSLAFQPISMETAYALLGANMGVAILPESGKVFNTPNLKFIHLEGDDAKIDVCAAWKTNNENPSISIFLKELRTTLFVKK